MSFGVVGGEKKALSFEKQKAWDPCIVFLESQQAIAEAGLIYDTLPPSLFAGAGDKRATSVGLQDKTDLQSVARSRLLSENTRAVQHFKSGEESVHVKHFELNNLYSRSSNTKC